MKDFRNEATKFNCGQRSKFLAIFLVAATAVLVIFVDYDGYEGDDLNSVVPMFHLQDAKAGSLLIYRYAWQPISYEIGAALFSLTRSPTAIFLLAPIFGGVSLTLMLAILWQGRELHSLLRAAIALFAAPEFIFSGLYFNSTIIGLPFALGSVLIMTSGERTTVDAIETNPAWAYIAS